MERQPTITVTEYEDNNQLNIRTIGHSLQRSTTDSIISYAANGNIYLPDLEISEMFEKIGQTFWIFEFSGRNTSLEMIIF